MKLTESAKLQIDLAFKRFRGKIVCGNVTTRYYQEPDRGNGSKEHCCIDIFINGERLPLVLSTTVYGKNQLSRAKRLSCAMQNEINKRKQEL